MSDFIRDNSRLNFPKSDSHQLAGSKDPNTHLTGSEWNKTCQSLIDVRAWIISGSYYGLVSSSINPHPQAGLSGTVGWLWLSSSLYPHLSVTSSAGVVTRRVALAPTGSDVWSGYWDKVLVDEQGIVVSGTVVAGGGGGGYDTIATGSNVSLPQQTKLLFVAPLAAYDDSAGSLTRVEHLSSSLAAGTVGSPSSITTDPHGHFTALVGGGNVSYTQISASQGVLSNFGSSTGYVSNTSTTIGAVISHYQLWRTGSAVAFIGLNSTNDMTFGVGTTGISTSNVVLTLGAGTAGLITTSSFAGALTVGGWIRASDVRPNLNETYDIGDSTLARGWRDGYFREIKRMSKTIRLNLWDTTLYITGSLTSSMGIKTELDMEVGRNLTVNGAMTLTSLTTSAGLKTNLDLEAVRNLTVGGLTTLVNLTASAGIKTSLDLEAVRNLTVGGATSVVGLTASAGIKSSLDLEATRTVTAGGKVISTDDISGSMGINVVRAVTVGSPVVAGIQSSYAFWSQGKNVGIAGASLFVNNGAWGSSYIAITNTTANQGYIGTATTSVPLHLCVGTAVLDHLVLKGDTSKSVGIGLTNANVAARLHVSGGTGFRVDGSGTFNGDVSIGANDGNKLSFFGATLQNKQDVGGSRGGNAALANLLTALETYGIISDSSTA
jgi:hypothetical protein